MHEYKDPSGRTRAAVAAVWAYLAMELLWGTASLFALISPPDYHSGELLFIDMIGLAFMPVAIACIVLVAMWIYRSSANAHALSDEMTISPGWAVGWYFVPIANLFKPLQAMREAWLASHYAGNWHGEPMPSILGWWWGLWIGTNILTNLSVRMTFNSTDGTIPLPVLMIDIAVALLSVPLCIVLVRMMKDLSAAQISAMNNDVFA